MKLSSILNEEVTETEYRRAIKDIATMVISMASEDAKSMGHETSAETEEEYENNLHDYAADAVNDLHEMIKEMK